MEIKHHGIPEQKWGVQNGPPYPLDEKQKSAAERRAERKDTRWARKNESKIKKKAYKQSRREVGEYVKKKLNVEYRDQLSRGKVGLNYIFKYNKKLAEVMNTKISDIKAPSGRVVQFIAKRGEVGVHMALVDEGYDMSQLRSGVYASGKVGYRKQTVSKLNV